MSGEIKICQGNVLDSGAPIIAHQTNCKGVMGAGVAKAIREQYREVYPAYRKLCAERGPALLGETQFVWTNQGIYIANCFAQDGFGVGRRQTDYDAFRACMQKLRDFAEKKGAWRIAMPYKIGCGLAGGEWAVVLDIIQEEFTWYTGTVELWNLVIRK